MQTVYDGPIIDFHIHPYLSKAENLEMFVDDFYLPIEEAMDELRSFGISHVCGSVIEVTDRGPVKDFEAIRRCNRKALELKEKLGDYYTPGFHVHPDFVEESLAEIEFMHQHGFRLIGELVPYMHGWGHCGHDLASRAFQEILDLAGDYNMLVSYHTMVDQQEQMATMIEQNPKVTFVAAHPGQKSEYLLQIERLKKYDNLYLDISGTGLFRYGMLVAGVNAVGAERLLFGTDYPITNPGMYVHAVLGEHISASDREKIFYKNAARLLQM